MSFSSEENDDATGNTPLEVERLLRPSAGVVSGEYMNRQESLSSEKVEEDDEEDADGEREGGDACVAAAETGNPTGGCGGKPGRKRGKDGGLCGAGNGAAIETIQNLLLMIPVDLEKLRNQAWEKGGYQTDELRLKAWPKLLGLDRHRLEDFRQHLETPHHMSEQIQRDIDRSLTHFTQVRKWKRQRQQSKREKLRDVINAIVRKYDGVLNYFQGYHDVVTMLLLVTGDTQLTYAITERVSHYFFRDSMRADFSVLTYLMHLLPVIMDEFDPELAAFVAKSKVEPYYCMAWVLTWFAHDLQDLPTVARLYDVLLGAHPTLVFYLCAAVIITARTDVLECECEFAAVHNALSQSARGVQDWEAVLHKTKGMFLKCPPRELVKRAPAYIKETLVAGGVTALEFPPPWFTGTSLPDWILLEQSREKKGKKRIGKAAKHWRRAARLAGAENPDEMLAAYLDGKRQGYPRKLLKKVLASVRFTRRRWKKVYSSPATLISTAVLVGAVSYTYHVSSRHDFPP